MSNGMMNGPRRRTALRRGLSGWLTILAFLGGFTVAQADEPVVAVSIETGSIGSQPERVLPAAETSARFMVHRSPIREDKLAITVVEPGTTETRTIEIEGLEAMSFNMICRADGGARLACGSRARAQLVNYIVRKEMTCRIAATEGERLRAISCSIEGTDLAEWAVRAGIARPTGTTAGHTHAIREARDARRGMWADSELRGTMVVASND